MPWRCWRRVCRGVLAISWRAGFALGLGPRRARAGLRLGRRCRRAAAVAPARLPGGAAGQAGGGAGVGGMQGDKDPSEAWTAGVLRLGGPAAGDYGG
jgi:hypothetical protein